MKKRYLLKGILTTLAVLLASGFLYLYTAGYRLEKKMEKPVDLSITGMINAKSIPEGAAVYLDGKMVTATNSSIGGVTPGKYQLKIVKNGFVTWEKTIEVLPELVTDITAILVSKTPRIEPLTQTGARNPVISPSLNAIAFFSQDKEKPGVRVLPLTSGRLNIFSSNPTSILEDTPYIKFSEGQNIIWSPDEKQLLIKEQEDSYYLVDLETKMAKSATNWHVVKSEWEKQLLEKKRALLEKAELDENVKNNAINQMALWSPDGKKFLYSQENSMGQIEYRVFNMENPLPIGEKEDTLVLAKAQGDTQPIFSWFADSFHLIMVEEESEEKIYRTPETDNETINSMKLDEKKGTVSLIRIDGTNKTNIYNGRIYSENVFSSPAGDKIILLTSFRADDQTDLYAISIR